MRACRNNPRLDVSGGTCSNGANQPIAPPMKEFILAPLMFVALRISGATLDCDLTQYRRQSGLEARVVNEALVIDWLGEGDVQLRAEFVIESGCPTVRELALRHPGKEWTVIGRNLQPLFNV